MATSGSQIVGRGQPVRLSDGNTYPVRFGFLALAEAERLFGSIEGMQEALVQIEQRKGAAPLIGPLSNLIYCGLVEEFGDGDDARRTVISMMMWEHLEDYARAVLDAIEEAFPDPPEGANREQRRAAKKAAPGSRGKSGSTSRSPSRAAPRTTGT